MELQRVETYETILLDRRENIAVVTLNRPDKKNAMNPQMVEDFIACMRRVEDDDEIHVMILTGSGTVFHAGMDLEQYFFDNWENAKAYDSLVKRSCEGRRLLFRMPKATIACVNGHAFGGGLLIMSLCDLAVVSDEAKIGLSEINFGIFPAGGATWSVSNYLSPKDGLFLAMTGLPVTAQEAKEMRLINKVVLKSELWEETWGLAETIARKNPIAIREAKRAYWMSREMPLEDAALDLEISKIFHLSRVTDDEWYRVALKQFKERQYQPGLQSYQRTETR